MKNFKKIAHNQSRDKNHEIFDKEWNKTVNLFGVITGTKSFSINLKHPVTKQPCNPHESLKETFKSWEEVQTKYDSRSMILEAVYDLVGQYLKPWQIANYLTTNRKPLEAFETLQEASYSNLGEEYSQHYAALSKSLCSLTYHKESLIWAEKAYQSESSNPHFQIILADAYFLSGQTEEASKIYQSRISLVTPSDSDSISEMFLETFSIEKGVLPSPVFAIQLGQQLSDPKQSAEFWTLAEAEFYYSPYFRSHHAYYLASKGQINECLAKLIALVQEMPWLQEASLNLKYILDYFNQRGNRIMPDFQVSLSKIIVERDWKPYDGMFVLQIQ
jgi:tetratricopeptide (TPR) repeat protein